MDILLQIAIGFACILLPLGLLVLVAHYVEYKRSSGRKTIPLNFLVAYFGFLILLFVILPGLVIFTIYSYLISLLLRLKHGSKFAGLLEGTDAIHTLDENEVSKNVGNILFVVKYNKDNFYETTRQAIIKRFEETSIKTPKLWYIWQQFSGYTYYLKDQITPEECVRKLEILSGNDGEEITKEDLIKSLSKYSNTLLPKNHQGLWEVLVGTQPVKWKTQVPNNKDVFYPVVFRMHHCLSDATELLMSFVRIFGDVKSKESLRRFNNEKNPERITIKLSTNKTLSIASPFVYLWDKLKVAAQGIYFFLMIPPILLVQGLMKANDDNILHGPKLSGEKHLAFGIEESPHYIDVVKSIKKRIPGTAFSEILLAAISASFTEYFQNNSKPMPDSVAAMVPVFPGASKLANFLPQQHDVKKLKCRNKFSLAVINLPVRMDDKKTCGKCNAINSRLELVKENSKLFKNSIDFQVNYFILTAFVGIFPLVLRKILSHRYRSTFMVSILPAPPAITALDGYPLTDAMFWVPNRGPIGMGFSVLSYDGRFQIGVIVDKALIPDHKDVQNITDGVYKYLDLLNVETDCSRV